MKPVLITGGVGFIGTNLAHRLLTMGQPVLVYDNLSRQGVDQNLRWLRAQHPRLLQVDVADVRDGAALTRSVRKASAVFHLAAQTAVTTSVTDPRHDFDVNACGTLQVLEAIRACDVRPTLLYTSTNKVYGALSDLTLDKRGQRYEPREADVRTRGVSEARRLDFHTPYGCSKGTADQYVLDYARGFGMCATVFRMSCIYGPHQCGNEDQGWVAHFALRALADEPISIYGDGGQVRDLLYVDDLIEAMLLARTHAQQLAGEAFNIGGGVANTASLLDVIGVLEDLHGRCAIEFRGWRPSDQRYYVSDPRKFERATGWCPNVNVANGIARMYQWLADAQVERKRSRHTERERRAHGSAAE